LDKFKIIDDKLIRPNDSYIDFNAIAKGYAVDQIGNFLKEKQIDNYLNNIDKSILSCVGVYAIEQDGIKLLNKIDGDYFSILGLPLLPLTQFLWQNNILLNE
jgi:hypothetical protein